MTDDLEAHDLGWPRKVVLALVALCIIVGGTAAIDVARLYTSRNNGELLNKVEDTTDRIKNATSPEAQARAAAATAVAVGAINDSTRDTAAVAIICARRGGSDADIKACVDDEFAKLQPPTSTPDE